MLKTFASIMLTGHEKRKIIQFLPVFARPWLIAIYILLPANARPCANATRKKEYFCFILFKWIKETGWRPFDSYPKILTRIWSGFPWQTYVNCYRRGLERVRVNDWILTPNNTPAQGSRLSLANVCKLLSTWSRKRKSTCKGLDSHPE